MDKVALLEPLPEFAERLAASEPPIEVVKDFLWTETTHLFFGLPRSGKSLFAQETAVACATGTAIAGRLDLPNREPVAVAYLTEEDGPSYVCDRMRGFLVGRGLTSLPPTLYVSV